jgi:hypothetical protein
VSLGKAGNLGLWMSYIKKEVIMDKYTRQIKQLEKQREKDREEKTKKLLPKLKKTWVGRCFRCKNSYGSDYDTWFLYIKITDVCSIDYFYDDSPRPVLKVITFQKTSMDEIEIETSQSRYNVEGFEEIEPSVFEEEYKKLLVYLQGLG